MKKHRLAPVVIVAVSALLAVGGATAQSGTFSASLSASEEVPVRPTFGTGSASFSFDGTGLSYQVFVQNIRNVVAAHIHLGQPGVNGPVVLTLFATSPPGVSFVGTLRTGAGSALLASGRGTTLEGPLAGQPMSALIAQMEAGNTYVNVHTNDGVPPADTGPGDFPGGEIRGQIRPGSTGTTTPPPTGTTPPTSPPPTDTGSGELGGRTRGR